MDVQTVFFGKDAKPTKADTDALLDRMGRTIARLDSALDGPEMAEKRRADAIKALTMIGLSQAAAEAAVAGAPTVKTEEPTAILAELSTDEIVYLVRLGLGSVGSRVKQAFSALYKPAEPAEPKAEPING